MKHNLITKNNYTLSLIYDQHPLNPRTEFYHLGTMACYHSRYNLGDKHDLTIEEAQEIEQDTENYITLPLYLYDHSEITMATVPFGCSWDSGKVGIIFVSMSKLASEQLSALSTPEIRKYLQNEVEEYDKYLTGDCWGYQISDNKNNCVDSCFGFYGQKFCYEQGLEQLEYYASRQLELLLMPALPR